MFRQLLMIFAIISLLSFKTFSASLALTKTVDKPNPLSGETFTYTLQYRCASTTEDCNGVVITDPLPASVEYVSLAGSIHTTNASYNSSNHRVTFTLQNPLTAGTVGQVTISVRFRNGTTPNGTVANNTATISASNATSVSSSASATAVASNKFYAKKYYSGGVPGQNMFYGVELCHDNSGYGSLNVSNVTVTDPLPPNTIFISANGGGVYNASLHRVTWTTSNINAGDCFWPQVALQYPSSLFSIGYNTTNTATVTYTPVGGSPITVTTSVSHSLEAPRTESYIEKSGSQDFPRGEEGNSHEIRYYNNSNTTINNFYLEDLFPNGLRPKSFETGNFYRDAPSVNKYVKYKTNLNATWRNIPNNPMDPWTNVTIQTSSLGLVSNEYIIGLRWEFGPDPWPVGSGLDGDIDIYYEAVPTTAPLGPTQNCITAGGTSSSGTTMTYASWGERCIDIEITEAISGHIPSTRKAYTSKQTGDEEDEDVTGDWFSINDIIPFELRVKNSSNAGANIVNPQIVDLLPVGIDYIDGSWTYDSGNSGALPPSSFVKTLNYKGTGKTHLKWTWTGVSLAPGKDMYIKFNARVTNAAGSGENVVRNQYAIISDIPEGCSNSGDGDQDADVSDLDNDGNTTEEFCFGFVDIDISPMPALSSEKYVKGQLDANWTKYPNYGNAVPGGVADYRLILRNDGNVAIDEIKIIDILPFVGDAGVIDLSPRNSRWRPNLAAAVSAPPGVTVYYSTAQNPCRSSEGIEPNGPAGCQAPNWSTSVPSDITTVQSLKFDFGSNVLNPSDSIVLEWPMRAPVNALATVGVKPDTIAWASFGYIGTRVDNNVKLLAAEPLKVGIRMEGYKPAVVGDQVWIDTNQDGLLNNSETGINGVRIELYKDNGDGTINTVNDNFVGFTITGNGGSYLFPNLPGGNYFLIFYLPPNYDLSPTNQGSNDAIDSDGTLSTNKGRKTAITPMINLPLAAVDLNWDLGIYPNNKASIGDYVWGDDNGNGLQDESSSFGVNGYTVNLYQSSNLSTPYATKTTINDLSGNPGFYLFEDLPTGNYVVGIVKPVGVTITTQGSTGSSDPSDSDANATTGKTETINLSVNEYDNTWDFGLILPDPEVCTNFVDDDGDGLIDCADADCKPNIISVAVTQPTCVNKTGGQITITATGGSSFTYSVKNTPTFQSSNTFTNLGIGQYIIRVKNSAGCEIIYPNNVVMDFDNCDEICNDGIDNDGDGLMDCEDPDCDNIPVNTKINN
jgi:uncharacterized repeat protein (TIGR01451 family)